MDQWRSLPNPSSWQVTPETARLLQHWRSHKFAGIRPFFCQVEAVETAIWLTEVAPHAGKSGQAILDHLKNANPDANPEIMRLALKLATGAGKTTVMAMLIAWQTINAVRRPQSQKFTRGFLVVAPGLTIKDPLRVLQPNDPDSYYQSRELVPPDMLDDVFRAKIVITNFHAFKMRERIDLSKGGRSLLQGRGEARRGPQALNFVAEFADFAGLRLQQARVTPQFQEFGQLFRGSPLEITRLGKLIGKAALLGLQLRQLLPQSVVFPAQSGLGLLLLHERQDGCGNRQETESEFEF